MNATLARLDDTSDLSRLAMNEFIAEALRRVQERGSPLAIRRLRESPSTYHDHAAIYLWDNKDLLAAQLLDDFAHLREPQVTKRILINRLGDIIYPALAENVTLRRSTKWHVPDQGQSRCPLRVFLDRELGEFLDKLAEVRCFNAHKKQGLRYSKDGHSLVVWDEKVTGAERRKKPWLIARLGQMELFSADSDISLREITSTLAELFENVGGFPSLQDEFSHIGSYILRGALGDRLPVEPVSCNSDRTSMIELITKIVAVLLPIDMTLDLAAPSPTGLQLPNFDALPSVQVQLARLLVRARITKIVFDDSTQKLAEDLHRNGLKDAVSTGVRDFENAFGWPIVWRLMQRVCPTKQTILRDLAGKTILPETESLFHAMAYCYRLLTIAEIFMTSAHATQRKWGEVLKETAQIIMDKLNYAAVDFEAKLREPNLSFCDIRDILDSLNHLLTSRHLRDALRSAGATAGDLEILAESAAEVE